MDNSAVQSQGSISSASLTNQAVVSHAGSSKSSTNPTEFVNHGILHCFFCADILLNLHFMVWHGSFVIKLKWKKNGMALHSGSWKHLLSICGLNELYFQQDLWCLFLFMVGLYNDKLITLSWCLCNVVTFTLPYFLHRALPFLVYYGKIYLVHAAAHLRNVVWVAWWFVLVCFELSNDMFFRFD